MVHTPTLSFQFGPKNTLTVMKRKNEAVALIYVQLGAFILPPPILIFFSFFLTLRPVSKVECVWKLWEDLKSVKSLSFFN